MTFENFARLTGATLLNTPTISSFEDIQIDVKKVKRGDLFISNLKEDIELALHLEAYAIVSVDIFPIIDEEIAWMRVDSLDEVLIRLMKFTLLEKKFRFIYLTHVELELIEKIADREFLVFLTDNEKDNFKKIINAKEKSIFFSANELFLKQIYPNFETLTQIKSKLFKTIKNSLFLSSFIYNDTTYNNIKLPPLFQENLENVINFLRENHISFQIEKCTFTSHFHPIFIDHKLQIKPFGKSDRVIICERDKNLIKIELKYLRENAPWAKKIIQVLDADELKSIEFNFAIINTTTNILQEKLEKIQKKEQALF